MRAAGGRGCPRAGLAENRNRRLGKRRPSGDTGATGDAGATPGAPCPAAAIQTQPPLRGLGHCTPGTSTCGPSLHHVTRALCPQSPEPRTQDPAPSQRARTCRASRAHVVPPARFRFPGRVQPLLPPLRARVRPGPARAWRESLCPWAPPSGPARGGPRGGPESGVARASDVRSSPNPEPSTSDGVHRLAELAASQGVARGTRGGSFSRASGHSGGGHQPHGIGTWC